MRVDECVMKYIFTPSYGALIQGCSTFGTTKVIKLTYVHVPRYGTYIDPASLLPIWVGGDGMDFGVHFLCLALRGQETQLII